MSRVGIRELRQNASAVVAEAAAGEVVTITDRGRPVAKLVPLDPDPLTELIMSGRARPAKRSVADLPSPQPLPAGARPISEVLKEMREDERF